MNAPPARHHAGFRGRIGVARSDITPPVGIYARNWGAATHDVAEGIHRPLTLTVLTFRTDDSESPLVLVDADLGWWRPLTRFHEFRDRILDRFPIEAERFLFAVAHTHAAAPLMAPDPSLPGSELLEPWYELIERRTAESISCALEESFDGTLDWHAGRCNLAANRDLVDPDPAKDRTLCGYNPEGPADDTLLLGRVSDDSGQLRALLVNYACHPTTLAWQNRMISPDYVGAMRETIEQHTSATAVFLMGASGELSPRYQYVGNAAVADRHGRQLGHAALATLYDMEPPEMRLNYQATIESGAPLAKWEYEPVSLSKHLSALERSAELALKDWPAADEIERQRLACTDRALEERLRRRRDIRRTLGDDSSFALPVYAWRIGDAAVIGCCCEAYSMLQQELRRRFPGRMVVVMNLINGTIGYLPPASHYDRDVYQAWQTPFERGGLEVVLETMAHILDELFAAGS